MDISTLFCKRESIYSFVYAVLSAYCVPFPVLGSEDTVARQTLSVVLESTSGVKKTLKRASGKKDGVTTEEVWGSVLCARSVAHSCPTLCDLLDCNPPDPSVHRISQATVLEWVTISSSRGSSRARDRNCVSCIGRGILYH